MSDFRDRLREEFTELDTKLEKLDDFIKSENIHKIDRIQSSLLFIQVASMKTYHRCLYERLQYL